jgi:hypothetical protein
MLVEGVGPLVAPRPVREIISPGDYSYAVDAARSRNQFRRYDERRDQWGRGIVSDPILVGMLGEIGVCSFLNRRCGCRLCIDTELRARGDGGVDLSIAGMGIDVKTRNPRSKTNLYRRVDSRGDMRALKSQFYVFCQRVEDRVVHLLGWISADGLIERARFARSPVGDWFNLEVTDSHLEPMVRLVAEISYRRSL